SKRTGPQAAISTGNRRLRSQRKPKEEGRSSGHPSMLLTGIHELQKKPTFAGCEACELTPGGADDTWSRSDVLRAGVHVAEEALERAGAKGDRARRLVDEGAYFLHRPGGVSQCETDE